MKDEVYMELMNLNKDYIDITRKLYRLNMVEEDEINNFYAEIDNKMINTNLISSSKICIIISNAFYYNNRYLKSYWTLFKKIYEKYHPKKYLKFHNFFSI